jgi:hypothetical protein
MKLTHSLGFLFLGLMMFKLPQFAPWLCPNDFFGNSVRATWLHLMGLTQMVIGASYLLRGVASQAATWLESWPEMIAATMTGTQPQPEGPLPSVVQPQLAEVIPVDFKPAWSEQQHAA